MNTISKMLRSGIAMLLALCLIVGIPVAAFAATSAPCGDEAAAQTVEDAVYYSDKAAAVVDVVVEYAMGEYSDIIAEAAAEPETYRSMAVKVIKKELAERADTVEKVGFDPNSDEDMTLLANEVYDVAIMYYNEATANSEASAEKMATIEVIRFALVEVDGMSEAEAVENAKLYYELNKIVETEGKDAAIAYAKSLQTHNFVDGVCTECGEEDPNYVPPATEPPATEPPATEPPATEPPATEPPATEPPATEPPATEPPATEPPATEPPATEPPATEPPATEPPATEPPATEPEEEKPSKPSYSWKDLLDKWFGKFEDLEPSNPTDPSEPEDPTDSPATEPNRPSNPIKPSSLKNWLKNWLSWLKDFG